MTQGRQNDYSTNLYFVKFSTNVNSQQFHIWVEYGLLFQTSSFHAFENIKGYIQNVHNNIKIYNILSNPKVLTNMNANISADVKFVIPMKGIIINKLNFSILM